MDRAALIALLLMLTVVTAPAAVAPARASGSGAAFNPVQTTAADAPSVAATHFVVTVYANGSARWTFQYRTPLSNATQKRRFQEYARRFDANDTQRYDRFRRNACSLVADARNATGRPMNASHFSKAAYTRGPTNDLGVVELSFTWSSFAVRNGGSLVVGDLFSGGLYLGSAQWLVVRAGPGLSFASASPAPNRTAAPALADSDTATWFGPREFSDAHPRIVFRDATTPGGNAETGTAPPQTTTGRGVPWAPVALGALVVGALAAVAYRYRRGGDDADGGSGETAAGDDSDGPLLTGEPDVSDEEMLPDEERVKRLLRDHGGRMRQVSIVEETEWSKSKVSMLLSDMEAAGEISRLRIGRENVVSLPGSEPDVAREE